MQDGPIVVNLEGLSVEEQLEALKRQNAEQVELIRRQEESHQQIVSTLQGERDELLSERESNNAARRHAENIAKHGPIRADLMSRPGIDYSIPYYVIKASVLGPGQALFPAEGPITHPKFKGEPVTFKASRGVTNNRELALAFKRTLKKVSITEFVPTQS